MITIDEWLSVSWCRRCILTRMGAQLHDGSGLVINVTATSHSEAIDKALHEYECYAIAEQARAVAR